MMFKNVCRLAALAGSGCALVPGAALARPGEVWASKHADISNTGRSAFVVPASRQGANFFDIFSWQTPLPGSPADGRPGGSSVVYFDGAAPGGADLAVVGYHWPKGVMGVDRHTGRRYWAGNTAGGETIGESTPAFSNDGSRVYVVNDATDGPCMAFLAGEGPAAYWSNAGDVNPSELSLYSPKVAPDGRIFLHRWVDRAYGATDESFEIRRSWAAATPGDMGLADVALIDDAGGLRVITAGRTGLVNCYSGVDGSELWSRPGPGIDASPTVDPASGNIYVPAGSDSVWLVGLGPNGQFLWGTGLTQVFEYVPGQNHPQRAQSAGCLSHDGTTFYFQTNSQEGDGALYAVNTGDGSLKWTYATGSRGWEEISSSPIVTPNGVIVVGNNDAGAYLALRDDGAAATLLDQTPVLDDAGARATAALSADGMLYLPMRTTWTTGNANGEQPTFEAANLLCAINIRADAQVVLPPPAHLRARALNHAVELRWTPVLDPGGAFDHYAVYRDTAPFDSVEGMTPIMDLAGAATGAWTDATALNGVSYYYAVTSVSTSGGEAGSVASIGPRTPRDETDLQVVSIARTPRYPRYDAQYSVYTITEPSGFGPYSFSAATGLGSGQNGATQRWPNAGDPVTYTATIRNRGTNAWSAPVMMRWLVNGGVQTQTSVTLALAPGQTATSSIVVPWNPAAQDEIRFEMSPSDARAGNNSMEITSTSVAFLSYIDQSYAEDFRESTRLYPDAASDDMIDWLNRHMARFNEMFAASGTPKRVHFDVLGVLDDLDPDPSTPAPIDFAIFPFRYHAGEGSLRRSGYYDIGEDYDYGLLHEMGHQLGLIDLYRLDVDPSQNFVNSTGYLTIPGLMHGVSHFVSAHSAGAMTHWLDTAHGYFGQYLYQLPEHVRLRILGSNGAPLAGATVSVYQKCERPGVGEAITPQVKFQGTTDTDGGFTLPNIQIDHGLVPTTFAGDSLPDNPFGYVAVVGTNGVFLIRVEDQGFTDYAWLDITEVNDAYRAGQTGTATFERRVALGGPIQHSPPADMAELNAHSWALWAQEGEISASDDTLTRQVGHGSLRVETTGGFDNYARYPGDRLARWNLSGVSTLRFWARAENPNLAFQNGSPWVRLHGPDGFIELHPASDLLNGAIGQWVQFIVPLAGDDTWNRSVSGTVDITNVNGVEIHADTWGAGFTLWLDGVSFDPQPCAADWNGSGDVNSQDFFDFLADFFEGSADVNNDGAVNSQDFFDFLTLFFGGC